MKLISLLPVLPLSYSLGITLGITIGIIFVVQGGGEKA